MTTRSIRALLGAHRSEGEDQLAAAALCFTAILTLSGLWIGYLFANAGDPGVAGSVRDLSVLLYGLPAAAAGVLVHAHWPGAPFGWVLLGYALTVIVPSALAAPLWVEGGGTTARSAVVAFEAVANLVKVTLWYSLPLWFPKGRLSRRWWFYLAAVAVWAAPQTFAYAAASGTQFGAPNPLATGWWGETAAALRDRLSSAWDVTDVLLIALSTGVLLRRILRGEPRLRRPLLLLLSTYLLWAVAQRIYYYFSDQAYWPTYFLFTAASALWPVSVGFVVVRTGSWRISRSARRILAGLIVTTLLTVVYVAAAAVLAGGLTPGRAADAVVLVALAFLLGAGLRRTTGWAVGLVDRMYYGDRAHPYQVLQTLAERITHAVSPQDIPATLCTTVVETLRLPGAALAVHTRAGPRTLAQAGRPDDPGQRFPLLHQGTAIGHLSVSPREGEQELDEWDTGILSSLANQAAPALASLRLQEDLRTSREQIVSGREEERRRLRRDIHDGLGPALAGLRLRVDSAAARLPAEDPVGGELRTVSGELRRVIEEVRHITHRLGPAPLGELGLSTALRQLAAGFDCERLSVTAALDPDPLPPLPAAVEVAAYRIAAEALTNVLRHARAQHAEVRVRVDDRALTLTVEDDGVGFTPAPAPAPGLTPDAARDPNPESTADPAPDATADSPPSSGNGLGIRSMADRAAEIGGRCTVEGERERTERPERTEKSEKSERTDGPGTGTSVRAVLPRSSAPLGPDGSG
ncbi:sensor histidine kinase [Streptomyces sp. NPDC056716]|uniref:sensor histidine kinase n=1 Tax=unclassified Streptomyces TaxID=2593676 RepID=UPI0036A95F6C